MVNFRLGLLHNVRADNVCLADRFLKGEQQTSPGVSKTPSYNEDVAVFTNIGGGLMLEGSIGGHRYSYKALQTNAD